MGKALYRKYRPKVLSEVVGENQVTDVLKQTLASDNFSHAYLFIGPRGCGKTSVARIFAHEINHFEYELEDEYVDIIEIDAASNTGVENIRDLREKATIAPTKGKYKVYIIDEVHMLSKSAFNALLKILEEPPKHVIFIMATTDAYKVPVTITSRAQVFTFNLASPEVMFEHLKKVSELEKINIEDEALKIIVKRGGGSFRDSLSLLDQISNFSQDKITKELIIDTLGLPEDEIINNLLSAYQSANLQEITNTLKTLLNANIKPETIAEEIINKIIKNPTPNLLPLLAKLPEVKDPFPEAKLLVALTNFFQPQTIAQPAIVPQQFQPQPAQQPVPQPVQDQPTRVNPIRQKQLLRQQQAKQAVPKPVEEKPKPAELTAFQEDLTTGEFTWDTFLQRVYRKNDALHAQLLKVEYEFIDNIVHIYPIKRVIRSILTKENNKLILIGAANGAKIEIHEIDEAPSSRVENPLITKISDIMGGAEEVMKNGGEIPF